MKDFEQLWQEITERSNRWAIPVVQNKEELKYIFNLIQGCQSYLEVGTAEGNSLYVLSHALAEGATVNAVDYGEVHTEKPRNEIVLAIQTNLGIEATVYCGNSHDLKTISDAAYMDYEVVFIDAGHTYPDVIADAIAYGSLATKYIIFHDICLPEVNAAFEWYCKQRSECQNFKIINSETFGYGVIKV